MKSRLETDLIHLINSNDFDDIMQVINENFHTELDEWIEDYVSVTPEDICPMRS
jgi:hypothetical protein